MSDKLPRYREPDPEPKLDDCYCYWCEQEKPEDEMTQEPELCTACLDRMKERDRKWGVTFDNLRKWTIEAMTFWDVSDDKGVYTVLTRIREYIKNL